LQFLQIVSSQFEKPNARPQAPPERRLEVVACRPWLDRARQIATSGATARMAWCPGASSRPPRCSRRRSGCQTRRLNALRSSGVAGNASPRAGTAPRSTARASGRMGRESMEYATTLASARSQVWRCVACTPEPAPLQASCQTARDAMPTPAGPRAASRRRSFGTPAAPRWPLRSSPHARASLPRPVGCD
jgi:hypothetical protein